MAHPLTSRRSPILRIANILFLVIACGFLIWFFQHNRADVARLLSEVRGGTVLFALGIFTLHQIVQGAGIAWLLRSLGVTTEFWDTVRVLLLSLLGKYLPGKIWIFTFRSTFFAERGVPVRLVLAASAVEHLFVMTTAVILFLATAPFSALEGALRWLPAAGAIGLFAVLVFAPSILLALLNRGFRAIGRTPYEGRISSAQGIRFSLFFTGTWVLLGAGVWVVGRSLIPALGPDALPAVAGGYALSVVSGFVALFAPGGIGVREAILAGVLAPWAGAVDALFLAVAVRILTGVSEVLGLGVAELIVRLGGQSR
ncbi:MAG: hypothetical protein HKN20_12565 [Gemmatimonadetes bacterium]|nr:hypothetical protein [Gemmatimonadota bacterium]